MVEFISYAEWVAHYQTAMMQAGVVREDARVAAQLGWSILAMHQACYGRDEMTKIHFSAVPAAELSGGIVAYCRDARCSGDREESYVVYAPDLAQKFSDRLQLYGHRIDAAVLIESIAVHEVRHRIQYRESSSLKRFSRSHVRGFWPNEFLVEVVAHMCEEYHRREVSARATGVSKEDIGWILSDDEFDADVIERIYVHRYDHITTDQALSDFLRMNCPQVPFASRT